MATRIINRPPIIKTEQEPIKVVGLQNYCNNIYMASELTKVMNFKPVRMTLVGRASLLFQPPPFCFRTVYEFGIKDIQQPVGKLLIIHT
jgi:hypothetical protein